MSSKKEEKGAAAERIKVATMSATKGLSRAQAERAAAAATRNVNAYGQKEEGPSRWQERKELKRKMYLLSTEKAVTLGVLKKDVDQTSQCQKCYQVGHWTSECKNERVYLSRPSRSQILKNPKLMQRTRVCYSEDFPDTKREEEEGKNIKDEKRGKKKSKRKHRSEYTELSSGSEGSESESGSDSGSSSVSGSGSSSDESASSYSSSSDSEEDSKRRRSSSRKKQKARNKRFSSSSESSDYDSSSDSDSRKSRRKSKNRSHRR